MLYTGDARALVGKIERGSVRLIFTDPVYSQLDDYEWLERDCAPLLNARGNTLAFVNGWWLARVLRVLTSTLPVLSVVQQSGARLSGNTIAKSYHLVWMGSGKISGTVPDGWVSTNWNAPDQHNFKWTKNPRYVGLILRAFTEPGDLVFDPFMGGGTIPAVCREMGRRYIGCEIDPERAKVARARVDSVQPMFIMPAAVGLTDLFGGGREDSGV